MCSCSSPPPVVFVPPSNHNLWNLKINKGLYDKTDRRQEEKLLPPVVQGIGLPLTGNMQLQLPEARIASTHGLNVLSAATVLITHCLAPILILPHTASVTMQYHRNLVCRLVMLYQNKYRCTSKTSFHTG